SPPLTPTFFPYTTLFRSFAQRFRKGVTVEQLIVRKNQTPRFAVEHRRSFQDFGVLIIGRRIAESIGRKIERTDVGKSPGLIFPRSEEHTSELQSRSDLVC